MMAKFIFIVGIQRSGKKLLLSLLDDHPDILAWPQEFFYAPLFYQVSKGSRVVTGKPLNDRVLAQLKRGFDFENGKGRLGKICYSELEARIREGDQREFTSSEYLDFLAQALSHAHEGFQGRSPKRFLVLTSGHGLDWSDREGLLSSQIIIMYRDFFECYLAIREKRKIPFTDVFQGGTKGSLTYWASLFSGVSKQFDMIFHEPNSHLVKLTDLQGAPEKTIKKVCEFLSIEFHSSLLRPTRAGERYLGNARSSDLRVGSVQPHSSPIETPALSLEKVLFSSFPLFALNPVGLCSPRSYPIFQYVWFAARSAFWEAPAHRVSRISKRWRFLDPFARIFLFALMIKMVFTSRKRAVERWMGKDVSIRITHQFGVSS